MQSTVGYLHHSCRSVLRFVMITTAAFVVGRPLGTAATLRIDAGMWDRRETPVEIPWPANQAILPSLRLPDGERIPVQIDAKGRAWVVLPKLKAGESIRCTPEEATKTILEPKPRVVAVRGSRNVQFLVEDRVAF